LQNHNVGDHYDLLIGAFQVAGFLCFGPQRLDDFQHVLWLRRVSFPKVLGPIDFFIHLRDKVGHFGARFDAIVPLLLVYFRYVVFVLYEASRLHDLNRVHRGRQNYGDERIRMERNWHGEFFKIRLAELRGGRGRRRGCRRRRLGRILEGIGCRETWRGWIQRQTETKQDC